MLVGLFDTNFTRQLALFWSQEAEGVFYNDRVEIKYELNMKNIEKSLFLKTGFDFKNAINIFFKF